MPAPSPMTNPSRSLSNGREAFSGSSLRKLIARIEVKPAIPTGTTQASLPPVTMTSASPNLMMRQASPMQWFAVAQAVTMAIFGPRKPCSIEITPVAMLLIIIGIMKGEVRSGPLVSICVTCVSMVAKPPTPLPTITPTRSRSRVDKS